VSQDIVVRLPALRGGSPQDVTGPQVSGGRHRVHRRRVRTSAGWATRWLCAAAGSLVVAAGYHVSQRHGSADDYYGLFWLGMFLMVAPMAAVLMSQRVPERARTVAALSLGLVSFVPKFLRNPFGPVYHDELAHFRSVQDVLASGSLFKSNPTVTIAGEFPGLHIATAAIQGVTGLPLWAAATILLLIAHIACLVAVLTLGRFLLPDPRAAGLAVVIYALNPGFLYFDTQFSYESLAICFFLWAIALTVTAVRSAGRVRAVRLAGAVALILACITTHHLTTLVFIVFAAGACAVHAFSSRGRAAVPDQWRPWATVLVVAAVGFAGWLLTVAKATYNYLSPYAGTALGQLVAQATGQLKGRELYGASVNPPGYERVFGLAAPPVMLVAFLLAVYSTRLFRTWPARRTVITFAGFGLLYFVSLPFIFASEGAEGARRSWNFTYLGLAVCIAGFIGALLWKPTRWRWTRRVLVAAVLFGLLIGNTGAGENDAYRFPGTYRFGLDGRYLTPEVLALADEFRQRFPDERIIADRYSALALVAYGGAFSANPSPGFRTYDLFFYPVDPEPFLVGEIETGRFHYLIVDERLNRPVPDGMSYFVTNEPKGVVNGKSPVPQASLDRFETVPWATKVLSTSHFSVYRLNFRAVGVHACARRGCSVGAP
jgi:hypothetical protein